MTSFIKVILIIQNTAWYHNFNGVGMYFEGDFYGMLFFQQLANLYSDIFKTDR